MKQLFFKILLLLVTLLVSLILIEVIVSIVRPDLAELARSDEKGHTYRIHANPRNVSRTLTHPDTGEEHLVIRNSLGFRQHREFAPKKESGTIRVGFFGDSFTENRRMPVAYCFTEPLQHLFDESGRKVEVMNFGTDGYGTDQAYLQYIQEGTTLELDHVVYLLCGNDLVDNLANDLYTLNGESELIYRPVKKSSAFTRVISRFATTYLVIQGAGAAKALANKDSGNPSEDLSGGEYREDTIHTEEQEKKKRAGIYATWESGKAGRRKHLDRTYPLLKTIVEKFRNEAAKRGQTFSVFFLPKGIFRDDIVARFSEQGIPLLDSKASFSADLADIETGFFENDPHWNEEGNKLAAVYLYRYLLDLMEPEYPGDEFVQKALGNYYDVFGREPVGPAWLAPPQESPENADAIRNRFLALEQEREESP